MFASHFPSLADTFGKLPSLKKSLFHGGAKSLTAALIALAATAAPTYAQGPEATARDNTESDMVNVVLSQLPPRGSLEYQYLLEVSGAVGGEQLPMSQSEIWTIEGSRADMFSHVYQEQGVSVVELDSDFETLMTVESENQANSDMLRNATRSSAVESVIVAKLNDPGSVEFALGRGKKPMIGNIRPPQSAFNEIRIPLSETETITAKRVNVYTTQDGCYWHGEIGESGLPMSLMWWPNGRMSGSFSHNGKNYVIKNIGGDNHAIMELNPDLMPDEHPAMPAGFRQRFQTPEGGERLDRMPVEDLQNLQDARDDPGALPDEFAKLLQEQENALLPAEKTDEQIEISVLFAYTKKAASHYSNIENDVISLAVEQTTQSFRNSKIDNVTVRIAGTYETDYDEGDSNLFNHLWNFADRGDRHMEEVHRLRDEMKADIAVLIVDNPTGCGLATRVAALESEAFAVVNHECATTTFSVAHEIGHLLGARHDRSLDKSTRPFPYGHGYANQTKWRTLMAYSSSCQGCARLPIWSSPNVEIQGETAGDETTNNARVISEQAARVAAFR